MNPFRLAAARQATFPKGTAFRGGDKVSGITIRRPLEERLPPIRGKMSPQVTKRGIWQSRKALTEGVTTVQTPSVTAYAVTAPSEMEPLA